jgi:hypothetical protein
MARKQSSRTAAFYVDYGDYNKKWDGYQVLESDLFDAIGDPDIHKIRFRHLTSGDEYECSTAKFLQKHKEFKYEGVIFLVMPKALMERVGGADPKTWGKAPDWEILK